MIPITSCHELVFFKLAAMCIYCIILLLLYIILLWSRRFRERLRIFIFFTVIITIHRLFSRFDRRNPRPWRVRKYIRGANRADHYYHESRTRFRQSTACSH